MMKVLVTGVSRGLGLALVREFIQRGLAVWGVARSKIDATEIVSSGNGKFVYSQCDVSKVDDVKQVIREMIEREFIPDVVILNASLVSDDVTNFIDFCKFKKIFDINYYGAINWIEEFLPIFLKKGSATFVAISSLSIFRENHKNRIAYSASKIALNKTFENLRLQYYPSRIKFIVFNLGRMTINNKSFLGITYEKAAHFIIEMLSSDKCCFQINFPKFQYILTRLLRFVPENIYARFIYK